MKKKVKTILFVFIVIGVVILNITYKNKNEVTKTKRKRQGNLAIMIKEDGAFDYTKSSSKDIPKGSYALNRDKSYCKNNGVIGDYDNTLGKISFSFIGTDSCYLYFDKIIDTEKPVISNLKVNGTAVTATLSDNIELSCYGISTSNSIEPTTWTTISGTTYNLSTTITTEGIYYLWVKDIVGNTTTSISITISLGPYGWETILINNGGGATTTDGAISYIKGKGTPNFANIATTNEGMYATEDDLGTTYYFRGAVNNNWVKFGKYSSDIIKYRGYYSETSTEYKEYDSISACQSASSYNVNCTAYTYAKAGDDIYWRIIRINGDGSIRMIYTGTTAPSSSTATVMTGTGTQIGTSAFNSSYNKSEYVGYMYTFGEQHGNSTSSTIKNLIEDWYAKTTLKDNDLITQDQIYCNDRSASTTQTKAWTSTNADYYYGSYGRIFAEKNPKLICTEISDMFTVKTSSVGNKSLNYPIGLITLDEQVIAGGLDGSSGTNNSYYLSTLQGYWNGSPVRYFKTYGCGVGSVNSSGYLYHPDVQSTLGVRPVISLSSKVKLSGNGTWSNIYIAK